MLYFFIFISVLFVIYILSFILLNKGNPANVTDKVGSFYEPFFKFITTQYNLPYFDTQLVINTPPFPFYSLICMEYTGNKELVNKFLSNLLLKKYVLKMLKIYKKDLVNRNKFEINMVFRLLLDNNAEPIGIVACFNSSTDYFPLSLH